MEEYPCVVSEPILYDIFNAKCRDDIAMYKSLSESYSTLLELGIGTGRIAIPLSQGKNEIYGVDNSAEMLKYLKKKIQKKKINNIIPVFQDMRELKMNRVFDMVICPFCTFNCLLSIEDQRRALFALQANITDSSRVVFDLMTINTFSNVMYVDKSTLFSTCKYGRRTVYIYTKSGFDQSKQLYVQERSFDIYIDDNNKITQKVILYNRIYSYLENLNYCLKNVVFE